MPAITIPVPLTEEQVDVMLVYAPDGTNAAKLEWATQTLIEGLKLAIIQVAKDTGREVARTMRQEALAAVEEAWNPEPEPVPQAPVITTLSPDSGDEAGGDVVTITGTGFTGATSVTFGPEPGTSGNIVSDTEATITTPAGTGAVDVVITNAVGPSDPVPFTYVGV